MSWNKTILFFLFFGLSSMANAQFAYNVNGFVTDSETGRPLVGVHVKIEKWNAETFSNKQGYYSISTPPEDVVITYEYGGFYNQHDTLFLEDDIRKDVVMMSEVVYLGANSTQNLSQNATEDVQSNRTDLPTEVVQGIPFLLGETDLIKTMQLLPGVDWGNEGFSNLYVRGGDADQNLFLLDGLPVYGQSHAFGLFSNYNTDVLGSSQFYKGVNTSQYGGRLSSVLDVSTKQGNNDILEGSAYVSTSVFGLSLDGPINEKTTFSFGFRRTYLDLLFGNLLQGPETGINFKFFDINGRVDTEIDENNHLSFFSFASRDLLSIYLTIGDSIIADTSKFSQDMVWNNVTSGVTWNRIFSHQLMGNLTLGYSQYQVGIDFKQEVLNAQNDATPTTTIDYSNGIRDFILNADFDYNFKNNHHIKYGINNNFHFFNTGLLEEKNVDFPNNDDFERIRGEKGAEFSLETAVYGQDEFTVNEKLKVNTGLRLSMFTNSTQTYFRPQPRFLGRFKVNPTTSLKAAYGYNAQMIHLLTNEGTGTPSTFWVPSTDRIKPIGSHQVTLGMVKKLAKGVEFTWEAYYKSMQNLTLLKDAGAVINPDDDWQDQITTGSGRAFGTEMMMYVKQGYLTGWLSYTLSKSDRQFDFFSEDRFPFSFDRTHMFKATMNYLVNDVYSFNFNFIYGTGRTFTIPTGKYVDVNNQLVLDFQSINNYRSEPYFRIDLGLTKESDRNDKGNLILLFNLYNFIGYNNPSTVYARQSPTDATQYDLVSESYFRFIPGLMARIEF